MNKDDGIVWSLCRGGDRKAFEILYRKYYPVFFNYGKLFLRDSDLIQNCIQNFFVKLISNHKGLSDTVYVRSYLLKAFRHTIYNELKAEQIRNGVVVCCPDEILGNIDQLIDDEETTYQNELIASALKKLSFRQREILYLFYIRELSHEEISTILNINYQSSKNLLFRSIAKLRDLLLSDPSWNRNK
ncbi:MAG: sigma-70 family RNA polymerase sigma factor [Massilibacteroides sp.]|nr:sigma-70 family RNA polymerase sigma factor [Massilibacteroides sp.]MDD3061802.1 sigma-70 family RNA polymerase sigma factor [Massilibacteroides sp.]MDD4116084.1 sigma-70 family RNA polymerase sigma factor [Massilibacteroides sp.]MDD4660084.1 sigma-70 family RNA polymerase sigma factor [Massilibacteroides sp.]